MLWDPIYVKLGRPERWARNSTDAKDIASAMIWMAVAPFCHYPPNGTLVRRFRGIFRLGMCTKPAPVRPHCEAKSPFLAKTSGPYAGPAPAERLSAPLVSALVASVEENASYFNFPGHGRGRAAPPSLAQLIGSEAFVHDLSELTEVNNQFGNEGAIIQAQKSASALFGSSKTWFLVGGTTSGVHASVMATCSPGETIILPRNSHLSTTSAMVLAGSVPKYIVPEYDPHWGIHGGITASQVEAAIDEVAREGKKLAAVLVTSPTYHGICSELREIAVLCHRRGVPMIVDEAHGAHFKFHRQLPDPALELGADLCVQSTHKVLCSLTQSSMLHAAGDIVDTVRVERSLQVLQSSSPSHLLLASLDATSSQISENREVFLNGVVASAVEAKDRIGKIPGFEVLGISGAISVAPAMDPLRLTVNVSQLRLSGYEARRILETEYKIFAELAGLRTVTFVINLGTRPEDIEKLVTGLGRLSSVFLKGGWDGGSKKLGGGRGLGMLSKPAITALNPREAFFVRKKKVAIRQSAGEVCGEFVVPYPPGIPVLLPGEVITEEALEYLFETKEKGAHIRGAADGHLSTIVVCDM